MQVLLKCHACFYISHETCMNLNQNLDLNFYAKILLLFHEHPGTFFIPSNTDDASLPLGQSEWEEKRRKKGDYVYLLFIYIEICHFFIFILTHRKKSLLLNLFKLE